MGYQARHVVEVGLLNTDDLDILLFAENSGEVILTHDTDYGTLLALHQKERPSVILFRLEHLHKEILFDLLKNNLPTIQEDLEKGAIVVVEEVGIRIRKLPIRK
ncbi:MAG: DUF5615 family PIN-like protein [Saprospiraceae bacterium]|nr:DUF5615 family PIN-like protein [Saprospiraceae bacterium]